MTTGDKNRGIEKILVYLMDYSLCQKINAIDRWV